MTKQRHTVLIVDDEPQNVRLLGELLREAHEIIVATSGPEAIRRAETEHPPDLILLDVTMPEMDGWEVCRALKANPATVNIPVIFVTARDDVTDETKGLAAGAVDYITKPFSAEIVKARVRTHLTLKSQADRLASLSAMDDLTGLANRRRFNQRLEQEWRRAMRTGDPLSVVMMDVDHFKQYNDNYGHGAGDDCLRRVAQALDSVVQRSVDLVARYGGEEFAAILPATNAEDGLRIGERFRQVVDSLSLEHGYSATSGNVTISAGVATQIPDHQGEPKRLLEEADRMLYTAKGKGRNCVVGDGNAGTENN